MSRKLEIALAVAIGFTLTVVCTVATARPNVPREVAYICLQLTRPGMVIGERFVLDPLGHIAAAWSLDVGTNTLVYSVLFWLLLEALRLFRGRRKFPS